MAKKQKWMSAEKFVKLLESGKSDFRKYGDMEIRGDVNGAGITVPEVVYFGDLIFSGKVDFNDATLHGLRFLNSRFMKDVSIAGAEVLGNPNFFKATFVGHVNLSRTFFKRYVRLKSAMFQNGLNLTGADIRDYLECGSATIRHQAQKRQHYMGTMWGPALNLNSASINRIVFGDAEIGDERFHTEEFKPETALKANNLKSIGVSFDSVHVIGNCDFSRISAGYINCGHATFDGSAVFDHITVNSFSCCKATFKKQLSVQEAALENFYFEACVLEKSVFLNGSTIRNTFECGSNESRWNIAIQGATFNVVLGHERPALAWMIKQANPMAEVHFQHWHAPPHMRPKKGC